MSISNNTTKLQSLMDKINALPEAGVSLPELLNPADAAKILTTYETIDENGEVVTGTMPNNGAVSATFDGIDIKAYTVPAGYTSGGTVSLDDTIDNEVETQADLINQIQAAVDGLPEAKDDSVYQEKTVTPSASVQTITADNGYDALSKVTVNAISDDYVQPNGTISVDANGTYDVKNYAYVSVNVESSDSESELPDEFPDNPPTSGGASAVSLPTVSPGFVQSTAEGSVIYTIPAMYGDGLSTVSGSLSYFYITKTYRCMLDTVLLANTPVIVLTSGTITMPSAEGYTLNTLASGTGYGIYEYVPNEA